MQTDLYVELHGQQINTSVLFEQVKEMWKSEGNKVKDLKSVSLYYKPDESSCYYVLNGEIKGNFMVNPN